MILRGEADIRLKKQAQEALSRERCMETEIVSVCSATLVAMKMMD